MNSPPNVLPEALRMLIAEGDGPMAGGHPCPDELISYSERELEEPERQRIQRHLAVCPDCARAVLDLESFPVVELHDEALRRSDEDEAGDWQALQQLIALQKPSPDTMPVRTRFFSSSRLLPAKSLELAVAALLAVAIGLGLWTAKLYRRVEALTRELSQPQADVFVSDLMPKSVIRNSATESVLRVPAETRQLVLILNLDDLRPFPDYQVEILDDRDMVFWQKRGLRRGPEGNFSLSLPRSAILAGPCQIRLYGLVGSQRNPLATYIVHVDFESFDSG